MATPAGQGYRSPLNLGLEQIPKTQDATLFQEFIPIYNAIHTLNAYLDRLRLSLEGGDPDKSPSEEMRITRGFWVEAFEAIPQGKVITITGGKARLGAGKRVKTLPGGGQVVDCFLTGVSMSEALAGENVRIGFGPAMLEVSGFTAGQEVWAEPPGGATSGDFLSESFEGAIRIGKCLMDDFIMIVPDYLNL